MDRKDGLHAVLHVGQETRLVLFGQHALQAFSLLLSIIDITETINLCLSLLTLFLPVKRSQQTSSPSDIPVSLPSTHRMDRWGVPTLSVSASLITIDSTGLLPDVRPDQQDSGVPMQLVSQHRDDLCLVWGAG